MESVILLLIIIVLLMTLIKSAKMVEGTFVLLARQAKISEFIVGFVILSIVTSLPEISIAIASSQEVPELSVGNMIGASAILLTLIIGLNAIRFKKVEFKGKFAEKEILIIIVSVFLMILTILDRYVSQIEGAFMLLLYVVYISYLNFKFDKKVNFKDSMISVMKVYKTLGTAVLGILFLIISSFFLVRAASSLAINLNISTALIGLFLLGLGTNVPELAILLTSKAKKAERELTAGNVLGSLSINPATVGLLAILSGGVNIPDLVSLAPAIVVCLISLILFTIFSYTGKTLTRFEGIILIAVFVSLIISETIILIGGI